MSSRSAFVRQAAYLVQYKAQLQNEFATAPDALSDRLHRLLAQPSVGTVTLQFGALVA